MKYKVHIEETLERYVYIEAKDAKEARSIVNAKIENEEIVLTSDDYSGWRFVEAYECI